MRHSRLKPDYRDTWHHCYNHAVGDSTDRPFDNAEKEQFVRILQRVADFYTVQVVAFQFMSNHLSLLIPALPIPFQKFGPKAVRRELRSEFARLAAEDKKAPAAAVENAAEAATEEPAFALTARRRVRYWVDGLVIGSELFIRETMRRVRPEADMVRHRLALALGPDAAEAPVYCWRRLRALRA